MASLGFVVVAVLLASVAAAPTENTAQSDVTTSTEKPTEQKCTLTDFGLKFAMKNLGVIAEDGRFIESGVVQLMNMLATTGLLKDQKPRDEQTMKQAAKNCNPVLNDNFVDSCKRPIQITDCLSAEYDKITSKRS